MLSREQVAGKRWGVCQALQDNVDKARSAWVPEACSSSPSLLPLHANLLWGKEDPLWQSHSIGNHCREMMFEKS